MTKANAIWEDRLPVDTKPGPTASRETKTSFIESKYREGRFLPKTLQAPEGPAESEQLETLAQIMLTAAQRNDVAQLSAALKAKDIWVEKGLLHASRTL